MKEEEPNQAMELMTAPDLFLETFS